MSRSFAELLLTVSTELQDATNAIFTADTVKSAMATALIDVSHKSPRFSKETVSTVALTKDITLIAEHRRNLLWVERLEYPIAQSPESYHNYEIFGNVLTMKLDSAPSAVESAYLWLAKHHICNEIGTTDLAGALSAQANVAATTLALNLLGTGTINENTTLTITGDTTATVYTVTAQVTIAGNAATVSIYPAVVEQALINAVVTLAVPTPTLNVSEENCWIGISAGTLAIAYGLKPTNATGAELTLAISDIDDARGYFNTIQVGTPDVEYLRSAATELNTVATQLRTGQGFLQWGQLRLATALRDLEHIAYKRSYITYSRS
jgi:hypothetical protein